MRYLTHTMTNRTRAPYLHGGGEAVFELIFHNTYNFTGLLDAEGALLEINRPALALIGGVRDEVLGRPVWQFSVWPQETQPVIRAAVARAAAGAFVRFETELRDADGRFVVIDFSVRPVAGVPGNTLLIAEGRDITAEREAQARYGTVLDAIHEGVVQQEREGGISACNGAAERILGLSREQMLGLRSTDPSWRTVYEDGSPYPGETHPAMIALRTGEPQRDRIMGVYKPDGSLTWIRVNAQPLFRPGERTPYAVVSSFVDCTALKEAAAELEHLALHDPLTGQPTRRLLSDRLEHALAQQERRPDLRPALLFVDLDNFKAVNDTFGHDAGDALLVRVAERLRGCVRTGDTVARLGGDEFVVLLEGPNDSGSVARLAERVGERLRLSVPGAGPLEVTASVGVAFATAGTSASDLLAQADTAMYRAKGRGRAARADE